MSGPTRLDVAFIARLFESVGARLVSALPRIGNCEHRSALRAGPRLSAQPRIQGRVQRQRAVRPRHGQSLERPQMTDHGRPLMAPGESYTFDMNLKSGRADKAVLSGTWTPTPIDVIEVPSVRWDDGTYEGIAPFPQVDARDPSESGRRLQLRRVIEPLRAAVT